MGVYAMLLDNAEAITRKAGMAIEVKKIGIRDSAKPRNLTASLFTTDLESIARDPEIDVIVEVMGGLEPAGDLIKLALNSGKSVVTANKELIAKEGSELLSLAAAKDLDLHFEAAVGGGIPLIQPLKHQLAGNDVLRMMGILNGTTNYILSKMDAEGAAFETVLAEAQALGYAEADPTSDVDGFDTCYKISILASIAFGKQVKPEDVHREGIRKVSAEDMRYADMFGYKIKLLGIVEPREDGVSVRVHPTMIAKDHPLASVNGVYNALWLKGDFVGNLMFSGRGAGGDATASAVVGDLIDIVRTLKDGGKGAAIPYAPDAKMASEDDSVFRNYLRLRVADRPKVLGEIAQVFGLEEISISTMEMKVLESGEGEIVFLTHPSPESAIRAALTSLKSEPGVKEILNRIRVEA